MSLFDAETIARLVEIIGWVILHFVWQGTLVAILVATALFLLRRASADVRYLVTCVGMFAMLVLPTATFVVVSSSTPSPPIAAVAASASSHGQAAPLWFNPSGALPWLVLVWSLGALFLFSRTLLQWHCAWSLVRRTTSAAPRRCEQVIAELRERMGIRRPVRILATTRALSPLMIGCLRPVILVPAVAFTGLTPEQLRAVLAHELAHVRRYDYFVNLVQTMIECLLFYHPGVWWLSGRMRAEREFCCDDLAVRVSGDTLCYVRALSALDEMRDADLRPAMASTGGSLMTRITRLVGAPASRPGRIAGWLAASMFTLTMTAAASAVTLNLPADLAQERAVGQEKKNKQNKAGKQAKQDKQSAKSLRAALIRSLEAEGLSEAQIKRILARMPRDAKESQRRYDEQKRYDEKKKQDRRRTDLEARIDKMRAEGMSDDKIERAMKKLRYERLDVLDRRRQAELKQKEIMRQRVDKLRAAGLTNAEIKVAVKEMRRKEEAAEKQRREDARAREIDAKRNAKIRAMREDGMSPEQIREVLAKMSDKRKKDSVAYEELERQHKMFQDRIAEMRSRGISEVVIEKTMVNWKREMAARNARRDRARATDRLDAHRKELINELRRSGASADEIQRRLDRLDQKLDLHKLENVKKLKKLEKLDKARKTDKAKKLQKKRKSAIEP